MAEQDRYNRILNEFLIRLVQNQNILKALKFDNTELDFSSIEAVDVEDMMEKQIFHYKFIPNVSEEATSYLCVSIGDIIPKTREKGGKYSDDLASVQIHCDVIVANPIATLNGGNRSLYITNQIVKTLLGDSIKNNIGAVKHLGSEQIMTMSDYHGYFSVFEVYDFADSYNVDSSNWEDKWK